MSGRIRKLSPAQLTMLAAMADGATFNHGYSGARLTYADGTRQKIAFHTWHSLVRRGSIGWFKREDGHPIGRITDAGRAELEAAQP